MKDLYDQLWTVGKWHDKVTIILVILWLWLFHIICLIWTCDICMSGPSCSRQNTISLSRTHTHTLTEKIQEFWNTNPSASALSLSDISSVGWLTNPANDWLTEKTLTTAVIRLWIWAQLAFPGQVFTLGCWVVSNVRNQFFTGCFFLDTRLQEGLRTELSIQVLLIC